MAIKGEAGESEGALDIATQRASLVAENLIHVHSVGTKAARSGIARLRKSIQGVGGMLGAIATDDDEQRHVSSRQSEVASPSPTAKDRRVSGGMQSFDSQAKNRNVLERTGRWLRRRRLDGSLNRIPQDFYPRVWSVLKRSQGLNIAGTFISPVVTREMTPFELKFALHVENVLNRVPQPEFRQLLVEALMVLGILVDNEPCVAFNSEIHVDDMVREAYTMFLQDQISDDGDATLCCAKPNSRRLDRTNVGPYAPASRCGGAAGICLHFYDSAPSGRFGSITYLSRAVALIIDIAMPNVEQREKAREHAAHHHPHQYTNSPGTQHAFTLPQASPQPSWTPTAARRKSQGAVQLTPHHLTPSGASPLRQPSVRHSATKQPNLECTTS